MEYFANSKCNIKNSKDISFNSFKFLEFKILRISFEYWCNILKTLPKFPLKYFANFKCNITKSKGISLNSFQILAEYIMKTLLKFPWNILQYYEVKSGFTLIHFNFWIFKFYESPSNIAEIFGKLQNSKISFYFFSPFRKRLTHIYPPLWTIYI